MGDERGLKCWLAASIVTIALIACGATVAADKATRTDSQIHAPVLPGAYRLPKLVAGPQPPAQPIPFSHAHHAGTLALGCSLCHVGAGPNAGNDERTANGAHMTLPSTQVCMNCHANIAVDRPNIQALTNYHAANEDVPWMRIYRVLDGVRWTHKPHLGAGIKCQTCHGDVGKMQVMAVSTPVTAMATCLGCHRATQVKSQCDTCHSWPGAEDFHRWAN